MNEEQKIYVTPQCEVIEMELQGMKSEQIFGDWK